MPQGGRLRNPIPIGVERNAYGGKTGPCIMPRMDPKEEAKATGKEKNWHNTAVRYGSSGSRWESCDVTP
ncbi:dihydrodipicolinate synthase [Anopheles sinensis]|uniref:Dihydrodipicolinate synthase n=1 Tax=Anopheles sinensis TaxID=74873 RepID=A0A084WL54_ANOSI|nr:dihydrodipicolinate synthase [Anopheles sinensis]